MADILCKILCPVILVIAFLFNTVGNWAGVGDIIPTDECPFGCEDHPTVTEETTEGCYCTCNCHNTTTNNETTKNETTNNAGGVESSTDRPTKPVDPNNDPLSSINVKQLITSQEFAGYRWNSKDKYYYADDKECWKDDISYNEVYDQMTPVSAMFIDCLRVRFNYAGKDWMVQFWKGQYGWLLLGAEISLFTVSEQTSNDNNDISCYNVAEQEDWLYMQLDCYYAEQGVETYEKIFSRPYDKYWWLNGFVKGQLTKYTAPRSEMKVKTRITLKDEAMADSFALALGEAGFMVSESNFADLSLNDVYYKEGKDIYIIWTNIYQRAF